MRVLNDALVDYELTDGCTLRGIDRDFDAKLGKEELYRELMLCENDLSSSPDFERFSPLFEEKYVAYLTLVTLRYSRVNIQQRAVSRSPIPAPACTRYSKRNR